MERIEIKDSLIEPYLHNTVEPLQEKIKDITETTIVSKGHIVESEKPNTKTKFQKNILHEDQRRLTVVRQATCFFICIVMSAALAMFINFVYVKLVCPSSSLDYRISKEFRSVRSDVAALRDQTYNLEKIVADVKMLIDQNRENSVSASNKERPAVQNIHAVGNQEENDELSPYRYSIKEVQTLQRLRLVDRNGNECTAPLEKHEKICKQVFARH